MIKGIGRTATENLTLLIGLSRKDFQRLLSKGIIFVRGADLGLDIDVLLTAGETEAIIQDILYTHGLIGSDTQTDQSPEDIITNAKRSNQHEH